MTDERRRKILVTGATRGIGLAIAEKLIADGFFVIGTGRDAPGEFAALAAANPDACKFATLDLSRSQAIPEFVREHCSDLYGLVNNAAVARDGVLATMHETDIEVVVQANLIGTMLLTKHAVRPMLLARRGRVVNISSIIGTTGFNGLSVYAASKAGLNGFTRSLARELGRANITVNSVAPGYVETQMTSGMSAVDRKRIERRSPLGRLATPEEVAGAVAYFISDIARGTTGTSLTVDAGNTA